MISPDLLQAALVAILRADAAVIGALPEVANGVREMQWKGTAFDYPNVRVERPALTLQPNGGSCEHRVASATVRVSVHSKQDSSRTAQQILGLVEDALVGRTIETAALRATQLYIVGMAPVAPADVAYASAPSGDIWTGTLSLSTIVSQR